MIWLGNSLPPLVAMTATVEYCQMACCRGKSTHLANSCSGEMSQMEMVPESIGKAEKDISSEHNLIFEQGVTDTADFSTVPIYVTEEISASDNNAFPFLQVKATERCDQTVCITNSSSGFGQRQPQPSDNYILLSFADKPRLPSVVPANLRNYICFKFTRQKQSCKTIFSRGPPAFFS